MDDTNERAYTSWVQSTMLPEGLAMLPDGTMIETAAEEDRQDELDVPGEYAIIWCGRCVGYARTEREAWARYRQIERDGGIEE